MPLSKKIVLSKLRPSIFLCALICRVRGHIWRNITHKMDGVSVVNRKGQFTFDRQGYACDRCHRVKIVIAD